MAEPVLVGVDVGTRAVKAGVVAREGRVLHLARTPTPAGRLEDGGEIHPTSALLRAVDAVVRDVVEAAGGADVAGIGIASMAEAGVPVSGSGEPIGEVLAWHDPRSRPAVDVILSAVSLEALFARTGLRAEAKHTLTKLVRLRRAEPARLARATHWAGVADLVGLHWTGQLGTAASLACRTLAFDLRSAAWAEELLDLAGWSADRMPRVMRPDQPVGRVADAAAQRLGVPAGTPVAIAGHDHVVGAFGAGVAEPGAVVDSMGTAEAVLRVTGEPRLDDDVRRAGFSVGAHVLPDRWYLLGGAAASGGLIEWLLDVILDAPRDPDRRYALLADALAAVTGPTNLLVRPTPRGRAAPVPDPDLRAAIDGIDLSTDRPTIALAVHEGLAFHVRWMLEELERLTAEPVREVRLIGGGVANDAFVALKASLGPGEVCVVDEREAVVLGAALVGGMASRLYANADEAMEASSRVRPVAFDAGRAIQYEAAFRRRFLPAMGAGRWPP